MSFVYHPNGQWPHVRWTNALCAKYRDP